MDWFVWWGNRLLGVHGSGGYCIYYPVGKQEQVVWDRGWMYKLVSWIFGCGMRWEERMIAQNWTLQSVRG